MIILRIRSEEDYKKSAVHKSWYPPSNINGRSLRQPDVSLELTSVRTEQLMEKALDKSGDQEADCHSGLAP